MNLSNLQPAEGSRKQRKRVGRGEGSGHGGTSTRGHKGAKQHSGYKSKIGFEGGQMPLQRRMPKVGFRSAMKATRAEVRLDELAKVSAEIIDLAALKAANVVPAHAEIAKVVLSGKIGKAVTLKGVGATKGARAAIEAAGGRIEA